MINNYCNQENDVYVDTLAADKAVSDLSEEQLRDVLEQLTAHNLPESEKCPLVRRLNAENASKDESDLVISRFHKQSNSSNTSNTSIGCNSSTICRNNRKSRHVQRSGSKDAEFVREKTNGSNIKKVHSSQSLQDLMSSANSDYDLQTMRAIGANPSAKRLNKASRAKSFTMPSGSQHFCNNNNNINNKEGFNELIPSQELRTSSQSQQSHYSSKGTRNKSSKPRPIQNISNPSEKTPINCSGVKSDEESGTGVGSCVAIPDPTISSRVIHECFATQSVYTDNHNMECDNNCTNTCNTSALGQAFEPQFCAETEFIEMKDLRRKVNIIEYKSDSTDCQHKAFNNVNSVDSFMDFDLKTVNTKDVIKTGVAERVVNHNCDYEPEDNRFLQLQGNEAITKAYDPTNCSNSYQDSDLANLQHNPQLSNKDTQIREKKKKRADVPVLKSEDIEGHIGFKDVEYLEAFVNSSGNDSSKQLTEVNAKNGTPFMTNSNVKESVKKSSKGIQLSNNVSKRKNVSPNQSANSAHKNNVSPNIPLSNSSSSFSSDEANSVSKHSDFAQRTHSQTRETTSPLNSSCDPKDKISVNRLNREDSDALDPNESISTINSSFSLITSNISADLLYTASDSEMADREKGFVTPKSKHLKRRKGLLRRSDNRRNQKSPNHSMQSSTSTTPSSSTVSGVAGVYGFAGMRGYESEREYTDDYRRKPNSSGGCSRRKSLSSVPHSEQNSAYNSDGELSSHSMPIRNDSLNNEKNNSESRTTPSSISSTPKASYADIAKTLNFSISLAKRSSVDAIYSTNTTMGSLLINTSSVQYQDFPQLDLSLTPVADLSTPSSPNNSMIKALVSPPQKGGTEKRDTSTSDSYSAPTSMTNTPLPQTVPQNECLFRDETVVNSDYNNEITVKALETTQTSDVSLVPAVIMCDYSESVPFSDIGSVTFGFFDDLGASCGQKATKTEITLNNESNNELKNPIKTSPEAKSHVNNPKLSGIGLTYIDVDKKSFNYEHIIGFIKKAWDNAKKDYQLESTESSHRVK